MVRKKIKKYYKHTINSLKQLYFYLIPNQTLNNNELDLYPVYTLCMWDNLESANIFLLFQKSKDKVCYINQWPPM